MLIPLIVYITYSICHQKNRWRPIRVEIALQVYFFMPVGPIIIYFHHAVRESKMHYSVEAVSLARGGCLAPILPYFVQVSA